MDQLQFDPANTANTDTRIETEGYENQVEEIQQAYPEQDWRTPAQIEEENQAQAEQAEGMLPEETEVVTPEVEEAAKTYGPNRFEEDPTTGLVNVQEVLATGVDAQLADMANVHLQYDDEERQVLVQKGLKYAENHTQEKYAEKFVNIVKEFLEETK